MKKPPTLAQVYKAKAAADREFKRQMEEARVREANKPYSTKKRILQELYRAVGSNLRKVRNARQVTQAELADAISPRVTRTTVVNMEAGRQAIQLHQAIQMADRLGVTVDHMIHGRVK